jgi:hypothetical protein
LHRSFSSLRLASQRVDGVLPAWVKGSAYD